jgi:hypothetical protein
MVHGYIFGVQYEIHLDINLDYFDDLLPICSSIRHMIELKNCDKTGKSYLILFDMEDFMTRFRNTCLYGQYSENMYAAVYHDYDDKSPQKINVIKKYEDVLNWSMIRKEGAPIPDAISVEELAELNRQISRLEESYSKEDMKKREEYFKMLRYQRIISNAEHFSEIRDIEEKLTNIALLPHETELLNDILKHPSIKNHVTHHGIYLTKPKYV